MSPGEARRSLLMAAIGAATIAASFLYAPWSHDGPVICPFRWFTGLPCPGCGLTRSFCAMTQGHWGQAWANHILGPILFAAVALATVPMAVQGFTRRPTRLLNAVLYSMPVAYVAATVLAGYHIVRLVLLVRSGMLWSDICHSPALQLWHRLWG
ncbi:MAG: DUF2752 domain-containing protein [Planctomycetota bacterium]